MKKKVTVGLLREFYTYGVKYHCAICGEIVMGEECYYDKLHMTHFHINCVEG